MHIVIKTLKAFHKHMNKFFTRNKLILSAEIHHFVWRWKVEAIRLPGRRNGRIIVCGRLI